MAEHPAQTLRDAAEALRCGAKAVQHDIKTEPYWQGLQPADAWEIGIKNALGGHPGIFAATFTPEVALALGAWLDDAASDLDMCERINSRDPYNDGKTRVLPHHLVTGALAVARQILGEVTE